MKEFIKEIFKGYNFKKLNKTRKAFFICYFFLGIGEMVLGAILCNFSAMVLGFICILEGLDLFYDQSMCDIIDGYQNLVAKMHNCNKEYLKNTVKIFKSKDEKLKEDYIKMIEEVLKKDEENDIK